MGSPFPILPKHVGWARTLQEREDGVGLTVLEVEAQTPKGTDQVATVETSSDRRVGMGS